VERERPERPPKRIGVRREIAGKGWRPPSLIFTYFIIDMSLLLSNSTDFNSTGVAGIITQLTESSNGIILGGVGVGISSLSFLIIAAQYLLKKFAPGPDGKRPSISSVVSGLFSSAKAQVPSAPASSKAEAKEETPVTTTGSVSIQIAPENLAMIQKMLELMNKPSLVVAPPSEPSL
jgi:hypothetical protein